MPAYERTLFLRRRALAAWPGALLAVMAWAAGFAAPAGAAEEVGEIVVTVRQRAESVKDVPGTVSVLSQADIEEAGVQRARDFIALTPGVSIVNAAEVADSQVNIRGINGARDAELNYALVIDGILMTNPAALNREYVNLQQIEVLKGPQGAIYGRNAAAGAFIITTQKPGDSFGGDVQASYAQDNSYRVAATVGGPMTDTIKWSLSGEYRDTDGYYHNKDTGNSYPTEFYPDSACDDCVDYFEDWSVAGRLIWEPSSDLTVDAKLRYGEVDAASITFNSVFQLPNLVPVIGLFGNPPAVAAKAFEDVNEHEFQFYPNIKPFNNQDATEFSVKVDYDFGWADLTAWGLYSDIRNDLGADGVSGAFGFFNTTPRCDITNPGSSSAALTGFPLNAPQGIGTYPGFPNNSILGAYTPTSCDGTQYQKRDQKDYSFEARLTSKSDQQLRWLGGLYYLHVEREVGVNTGIDDGTGITEDLYVASGANQTQQLADDDFGTDVYAVFGQVAYDLTETIETSLALRYDREERDVRNKVPTSATTIYIDTCLDGPGADPINPGLCATGSIPKKSKTFDKWEPKLSITWDTTENLTTYATAGVGFKSGGFNNQGSEATVNGFINDQVVIPNPTECGDNNPCTLVTIHDDYKSETSLAFEVGAKTNWLDNRLRIEGAYYYTSVDDMQFFEFFVGPFGLLRVVSNIDAVTLYGIEGDVRWMATDWLELHGGANFTHSRITKNSSRPDTVGNESPYTPEYTANLGAQITLPMTPGLDFIANVEGTGVGATWFHAVQDQTRPTMFSAAGVGPGDYSVTKRDRYWLVDARVGVQSEHWTVVAFGKNVFDHDYIEEAIPAPEFGGTFIHAGTKSRFGVEATYKF